MDEIIFHTRMYVTFERYNCFITCKIIMSHASIGYRNINWCGSMPFLTSVFRLLGGCSGGLSKQTMANNSLDGKMRTKSEDFTHYEHEQQLNASVGTGARANDGVRNGRPLLYQHEAKSTPVLSGTFFTDTFETSILDTVAGLSCIT
jgi:hypothetical protein